MAQRPRLYGRHRSRCFGSVPRVRSWKAGRGASGPRHRGAATRASFCRKHGMRRNARCAPAGSPHSMTHGTATFQLQKYATATPIPQKGYN